MSNSSLHCVLRTKKIEDDATGPPKIEARIGNETSALVYIRHGRDLLYREKSYRPRGHCVFKQSQVFFVIVHLNWCYVILFRVAIGIGNRLPLDYYMLHM